MTAYIYIYSVLLVHIYTLIMHGSLLLYLTSCLSHCGRGRERGRAPRCPLALGGDGPVSGTDVPGSPPNGFQFLISPSSFASHLTALPSIQLIIAA